MIEKRTLRTIRRFKKFDLVEQEWATDYPEDAVLRMEVYVTKCGLYLGSRYKGKRPWYVRMVAKYEVDAELRLPSSTVCSIGRGKDGRWHGWSHRAHCSFGVGNRIFEERFGGDDTPFIEHGNVPIVTDDDAKLAASNFARSVS